MQILFNIFMCTQDSSKRIGRLEEAIVPKAYIPFETNHKV